MRIMDSSVRMASVNLSYRKSSYSGSSFMQNMSDFSKRQEGNGEEDGIRSRAVGAANRARKVRAGGEMEPSDEYRLRLALFRQILEVILGRKDPSEEYLQTDSSYNNGAGVWRRANTSGWIKAEIEQSFMEETSFESEGLVLTADGRQISFGVSFTMSRRMSQRFEAVASLPYILTDPLVINLSDQVTQVSDRKFYFDLDADGEKEEICFAGKGSGFLALDRNGDGEINDGSELFGTVSGDGFKDLAEYDSDHNGWIDENDGVFDRLRVWTKDPEGKDVLLSLKEADVGAISLLSTDTGFSLYAGQSYSGELRKSGIYLSESTGAARVISQVDLASVKA